jgi:hypothetical protein
MPATWDEFERLKPTSRYGRWAYSSPLPLALLDSRGSNARLRRERPASPERLVDATVAGAEQGAGARGEWRAVRVDEVE